jgi:hypothetical protein
MKLVVINEPFIILAADLGSGIASPSNPHSP